MIEKIVKPIVDEYSVGEVEIHQFETDNGDVIFNISEFHTDSKGDLHKDGIEVRYEKGDDLNIFKDRLRRRIELLIEDRREHGLIND